MIRRRSRLEVYIDVLRAITNGRERMTHIMRSANLEYTMLKEHLELLSSADLINIHVGPPDRRLRRISIITATSKCYEVLSKYDSLVELVSGGDQLNAW